MSSLLQFYCVSGTISAEELTRYTCYHTPMAPPVLLGFQRPPRTSELLGPIEQVACAVSGLVVALVVFWFGYSLFTGALSGLGLLAGTGLVVVFFLLWGLSWAATEHLACRRRRG